MEVGPLKSKRCSFRTRFDKLIEELACFIIVFNTFPEMAVERAQDRTSFSAIFLALKWEAVNHCATEHVCFVDVFAPTDVNK